MHRTNQLPTLGPHASTKRITTRSHDNTPSPSTATTPVPQNGPAMTFSTTHCALSPQFKPPGAPSLLNLAHSTILRHLPHLTSAHLSPLPWHLAHPLWTSAVNHDLATTHLWAAFVAAHPTQPALHEWRAVIRSPTDSLGTYLDRIRRARGPAGSWATWLRLRGGGEECMRRDVVGLADLPGLCVLEVVGTVGAVEVVDDGVVRNWGRRGMGDGCRVLVLVEQRIGPEIMAGLGAWELLERVAVSATEEWRGWSAALGESGEWEVVEVDKGPGGLVDEVEREVREGVERGGERLLPEVPLLRYELVWPVGVREVERELIHFRRRGGRIERVSEEVHIQRPYKRPPYKRPRLRNQKGVDYGELLG